MNQKKMKKIRLIDANALNLEYEVDMADDWKTAHEIANVVKYAPTIDAIPISFIEKKIESIRQYLEKHGGEIDIEEFVDRLIYKAVAYERLIEEWREKNGTETD